MNTIFSLIIKYIYSLVDTLKSGHIQLMASIFLRQNCPLIIEIFVDINI